MSTNLADLVVRIGGDASPFIAELKKGEKALDGFGEHAMSAVKTTTVFATAAIAAAAAVLVFAKANAEAVDQIGKFAQKAGVSTEVMSAFKYAADLADVSTEQLSGGLGKLAKVMQEAQRGSLEAREALVAMGFTQTELNGPLMQTEETFLRLAEKFSRMEDGAGKTALAMRLFGKSGAELIPLLNQGRDGIQQATEEARKFGLIVSTEAAKRAEEFNDNLKRLKSSSEGFAREMSGPVVEALNKVAAEMLKAKKEGDDFFSVWIRGWRQLVTGDDTDKFKSQLAQAEKQLSLTSAQLEAAKKAAESDNGKMWPEQAAASVQKYAAAVAVAQAEVDRLRSIQTILLGPVMPAAKKESDKKKEEAPVLRDLAKEMAREQEVREAMHRVRVADDDRELKQIEFKNTKAEELRLHQLAMEQELAARMAARAANPMADDESNQSLDPARDARLVALRQSLKSAQEIEIEAFNTHKAMLAEFTNSELGGEANRQTMLEQMEANHQSALLEIRGRGLRTLAEFSRASWTDQSKHMIGMLAEMTAGAAQHNKAMFEINKVASTANAIVKGWEAVQSSYAFGTSWGGPAGGMAMAALATTAALANIQAIQQTSFGSGVSPSVGATPAPAVTPIPAMGSSTQSRSQGTNTTIVLNGEFFSGASIRRLLDALDEEERNGGRVVVAR